MDSPEMCIKSNDIEEKNNFYFNTHNTVCFIYTINI